MTEEHPLRGGTEFDTGLDWTRPDTITDAEAAGLRRWYVETHGEENLDLTPFVPFVIEHMPGAFKRYRRHIQTINSVENGIPQAVTVLLFLYHYTMIGNERGILYEVIAARETGVTKRQVLDVIHLAFLASGPFSVNAVAASSSDFLNRWQPAEDEANPRGLWPESWRAHPSTPRPPSLDYSTTELTGDEWATLQDWYRASGDDVPPYVRFLAAHRPDALKTTRYRYDGVLRNFSAPPQIVPLTQLHTATVAGRPHAARNAATAALRLGVTKEQVLQTVLWGFLSADEAAMNDVAEALGPVIDGRDT